MFDLTKNTLQNVNKIADVVEEAVKQVNPKVTFIMVLSYWICATPAEA